MNLNQLYKERFENTKMAKAPRKHRERIQLTEDHVLNADLKKIINMCIVGGVTPEELKEALDAKTFLDKQQGATKETIPTVLDKAKVIVYGDREESYGPPRKNWEDIAALWNVYFNSIKMRPSVVNLPYVGVGDVTNSMRLEELQFTINAQDAAQMMALLKIARLATNQGHEDSLLDLAGYTAVIERIKKNT
jgi:hypothetical protein